MILAVALLASPVAAHGFSTVGEFQPDFEKARECRPIEGRRLWVGEKGYYIQDWLFASGDSGLLDDDHASAIPFSDNTKEDLADFEAACK